MAALDPDLELQLQYGAPQSLVQLLIDWTGGEDVLRAKGVKLLAPIEDGTAMVEMSLTRLAALRDDPDIGYMEMLPRFVQELDVSRQVVKAPAKLGTGGFDGPTGKGVLIGIIDGDIDVFHESLRNPDGTTRLVQLWDMRPGKAARIDGLKPPAGYSTGLLYTKADIDLALSKPAQGEDKNVAERRNKLSGNLRMLRGKGHGTAVASIAAGNGRMAGGPGQNIGIAPDAKLIVVVIKRVFDFSVAMRFLRRLIQTKPGVINLSAGEHHGPHLPDARVERWFTTFIEKSGIPLVKSAGNGAGRGGHATGVIKKNTSVTLDLTVDPGAIQLTKDIGIQIWYGYGGGDPALAATITAPGGKSYDIPYGGKCVAPASLLKANNRRRPDHLNLSAIGLRVSPKPGVWTIRMTAPKTKDVTWHAWINWTASRTTKVRFSTPALVNDATTYTLPAAAPDLIVVASFVTKDRAGKPSPAHQIAASSARGPAADGKTRVITLAAPGESILAAAPPDPDVIAPVPGKTDRYVLKAGTSFAAPHVTGAIALMLEKDPFLLPAEIAEILSKRDPGETLDVHTWGSGKLDIKKILIQQALAEDNS